MHVNPEGRAPLWDAVASTQQPTRPIDALASGVPPIGGDMRVQHLSVSIVTLLLASCASEVARDAPGAAEVPVAVVASAPHELFRQPSVMVDEVEATSDHNKSPGDLLVMTVNARIPRSEDTGERDWDYRKNKIRDMIRSYNNGPDAIAIQELRDYTFDEVADFLSDYWGYAVNRGDGEYNAVFLKGSRLQPLAHGSHRYDFPTGPNRIAVWYKAFDASTGQTTYIYSTHFPVDDSFWRIQMGDWLAHDIAHRSDTNTHVIVMGDFNDGIKADVTYNKSYLNFIEESGLYNAYDEMYPLDSNWGFSTEDAYEKSIRHGRMIDHVFYSGGLAVFDADIDHSMFTNRLSEDPGRLVYCQEVTNNRCSDPNHTYVFDLAVYSDHFAAWAKLHYW